jgi:hypothetical protein
VSTGNRPSTAKSNWGEPILCVITVIMLAESLVVVLVDGRTMTEMVPLGLIHLSVATLLAYLLWTGAPLFRWFSVFLLAFMGSWRMLGFLLSEAWWGAYVAGYYALLCYISATMLLASNSVRGLLRDRKYLRAQSSGHQRL